MADSLHLGLIEELLVLGVVAVEVEAVVVTEGDALLVVEVVVLVDCKSILIIPSCGFVTKPGWVLAWVLFGAAIRPLALSCELESAIFLFIYMRSIYYFVRI